MVARSRCTSRMTSVSFVMVVKENLPAYHWVEIKDYGTATTGTR